MSLFTSCRYAAAILIEEVEQVLPGWSRGFIAYSYGWQRWSGRISLSTGLGLLAKQTNNDNDDNDSRAGYTARE